MNSESRRPTPKFLIGQKFGRSLDATGWMSQEDSRVGNSGGCLPEWLDGNVEVSGVDDSVSLELYPDSIRAGARKGHAELDLRATIGQEGVLMDHVDQVIALGERLRTIFPQSWDGSS